MMPSTPRRTVVSDELADLAAIYDHDVNACLIRGAAEPLPECVELTRRVDTWRKVLTLDEGVGLGEPAVDEHVRFLVCLLADLTGVDRVGVRVRSATAPMCPQFHVDRIPLRLVCTYSGPGTQWLDELSPETTLTVCGRKRAGFVRQAERGDIVLLKGDGWHDNEGGGVVHRSPPHDEGRLVVSLDPLA